MFITSLAPPSISRGSSRPDFVCGFGLDIPEEEEPQEEVQHPDTDVDEMSPDNENSLGLARVPSHPATEPEGMTPVTQSRMHSRHVSRLSHALSLYSVGGIHVDMPEQVDMVPIRSPVGNPTIDDLDQEAVGEWTGSEDVHLNSDDEESIGEWSNPSDEERARQERLQRRLLRQRNRNREMEMETPRRLPNFPAPPTSILGLRVRRDFDLVSNPSEDEMHAEQRAAFLGVDPDVGRSLLSHTSRNPSAHFMTRDPEAAHYRSGSDQPPAEQYTVPLAPPSAALNPHAKPFVFGGSQQSSPWGSLDGVILPPAPAMGHTRLPSFGKPLNAAAQEFKPGFTFRPPSGVPQLTFPVSPASRPLPALPVKPSPARAQQGREKRQRRGSHGTSSEDGSLDSGKENMASFRFPPVDETSRSIRHTAPNSPYVSGSQDLHVSGGPLQPLTFSGFPSDSMRRLEAPQDTEVENDLPDNDTEQLNDEEFIRQSRSRNQNNPTSTNTVPAGVFKALVGEEKTRRTVRSRLGSHEIFDHSQRPSLDDLAMPAISMSANRSRSRFVTDPGLKRESIDSPDIFTPAIKRRSSLPAMHSAHTSSLSNLSIPAINLTKRLEAQAFEDKIEAVLDEKFQMIRSEIAKSRGTTAASISPATEDAIAEVVALFRTQLQESAARGLDDSQMDARGELDLELIRDVVQRGHAENLLLLQTELREALSRIEQAQSRPASSNDVELVPIIDQINHRNLQVILSTLGQLSSKIDTQPFANQYEKSTFIEEILTALSPHLQALREETVDYDVLTARLSQAVKPNIEQLIDLAADKRETAGLIVDSLLPLLPSPSSLDTDTLISQITSEVRRVIAPIDAHEIKEQVADLVVERLDARLTNRDKAFNADSISSKVVESVLGGLESFKDVAPKLDTLAASQESLSTKNDDLAAKHADLATLVSSLPSHLEDLQRAVEATRTTSAEPSQSATSETSEAVLSNLRLLQTTVEGIASGQNSILAQKHDLVALQHSFHQVLTDRLDALPETLNAAVTVLQNAHAEFAVSRDAAKCDAEEIRKLKAENNDLQVQLAKARGAHGQVRVDKDNLSERLKDMENDRDSLRVQVEELQATASEVSAVELRNSELEDALSQSLARLKTSDVAAQTNQEHITELEKVNRDAVAEQQALKAQFGDLQIQLKLAEHEKELTAQSLELLRQEHESLIAQQNHWEDLRRVTEQIEVLTNSRSQVDEDELRELRRARDQHRQLESECSALQKRVRDQELRAANSERTATTAKQSLIQAQQRASEWERRAREYESDLEMTRNKLDDVEQAHAQLDADYSLAKLQLEEREAEDRLVKDRENKLRDQVSSLESQLARLESELSKAKAQTLPTHMPSYSKPRPTKNASPPRPDSRASTAFVGDPSRTPVGRVNGALPARSDTPPQTSVWDSMHAPTQRYPNIGSTTSYVRRAAPTPSYRPQSVASSYVARSVASPTPSTVTVDENGWWA
ncbi:hypothetical protein JVT61DRAFT_6710 [Boletus reticuloceps]|uniref:Uncharacterized protein n=1 Tax=Boletus reticuloceps TaxID=495285 RepID=A0A8I2YKU8_9AGAM|nr:hypothetical protein JVT61DRAFT_6710 [Boletus reticuloceps]